MEAAAHAASAGNLLGRRSRLSSFTSMLPTGLGPTTSNKKLLPPGPPATAEPGQGNAAGQGGNTALPGESRGGAAADEAPARPPKERGREITRGDSFFREANGPAAPADVRPDLGCKSAPGREASRQMATGEGASGGGGRRPVRGPSRPGSRDWVVAAAPAACDDRYDA